MPHCLIGLKRSGSFGMLRVPTNNTPKETGNMENFIIAGATVLTAIFTGVGLWRNIRRYYVKVLPVPDGRFEVFNPFEHRLFITKLVVLRGTFWSSVGQAANGSAIWGDSGKTELAVDVCLLPHDEKFFHEGVCLDGKRRM